MQAIMNSFRNTSMSLMSITAITHALIITSTVLSIIALTTNTWLVADNKQSASYGLLGYESYDSYNDESEYVYYTQYRQSDGIMYTYKIVGWILFVLLIAAVAHNLATAVITILTWPVAMLSARKYKPIAMTLQSLSTVVQIAVVLTWFFTTRKQRQSSDHITLSTSYTLEMIATLLSALSLPLLYKMYSEYEDYSYLPLTEDNDAEPFDPRDVLYPLRQKQKQKQYQ